MVQGTNKKNRTRGGKTIYPSCCTVDMFWMVMSYKRF